MIKITTPSPGFVRINNSIYNGNTAFKIIIEDLKVGITEHQPHGSQWLVAPSLFSEYVDDNDIPFSDINTLIGYLELKLKINLDSIALGLSNIIDTNLALVGNPAVVNMNVNGSVTPQVFESVMSKDSVITKLWLYIEDNAAFTNSTFGALPTLTNGCILVVSDEPVGLFKTNQDIAMSAQNIFNYTVFEALNRHFMAYREFRPNLFVRQGQKIQMIIRDNLTGLVDLNVKIQGYRI
jgi:hypothetical protein